MANVCSVRTTSVFLLLFLIVDTHCVSPPWILSVSLTDKVCYGTKCELAVSVSGVTEWSITSQPGARGGECTTLEPFDNIYVEVPRSARVYFCAKADGVWRHQGAELYLDEDDVIGTTREADLYNEQITADEDEALPSHQQMTDGLELTDSHVNPSINGLINDLAVNENAYLEDSLLTETFDLSNVDLDVNNDIETRFKRQTDETSVVDAVPENRTIKVLGLRVEHADKEPKVIDEIYPSVLSETKFTLRLFGEGLTEDTVIAFTHVPATYGVICHHLVQGEYKPDTVENDAVLFKLTAPPPLESYTFYICAKNTKDGEFIHQGEEKWKILGTHNKLLPLWASLILIVILLMLASLFSGLNLGLMALDRTELKIIANTGTEKERKYARAIMPVRSHGNYLLCTILLSNVAVNSTFTVILDDLTSGLVAVIGSTLAIVFIAEITPQAVCARHGLFVGAKSIWIMKIVMGICAPLAWPTSKLLDYFLGEEIGTHYNRERLKELVKVTNHVNDLDKEEVNIISGALDLRKKTVADVMTKLEDVFMLPINSVLDFDTMSDIVKSGYSRIPVYEGARTNIVTVLFIKDLAFVDPDDNTPLRTLCQYYQNPCNFVFEDIKLDVMLKQFKEGHKGHMAFVQRIKEGEGDPVYETTGLVTLEDVIEEMIQAEIVDETDVYSDNRTKRRLARPLNKLADFAAFAGHHQQQRVHISPQLVLAAFQYLNTSVDPFRPELVSETVLRRLLRQDVVQHIKIKGDELKDDPHLFVYQEGKAADYFVLIVEGRAEVTVGREGLVFEAGPFTYFGVQALAQNVGLAESPAPSRLGSLQNINMDAMLRHTFVPDYSVRAVTELFYITVKRSMYLAAKRATLMEKGALNTGETNEQIEPEVDKLLLASDEATIKEEKPSLYNSNPTSASPITNSTFKSREERERSPEEETLLKK